MASCNAKVAPTSTKEIKETKMSCRPYKLLLQIAPCERAQKLCIAYERNFLKGTTHLCKSKLSTFTFSYCNTINSGAFIDKMLVIVAPSNLIIFSTSSSVRSNFSRDNHNSIVDSSSCEKAVNFELGKWIKCKMSQFLRQIP